MSVQEIPNSDCSVAGYGTEMCRVVRTKRDPRDKLSVSETEIVDVVGVGVVRNPDLFVSVTSDDVIAASAEGHVQQHGQVTKQADVRVVFEVKPEHITALV